MLPTRLLVLSAFAFLSCSPGSSVKEEKKSQGLSPEQLSERYVDSLALLPLEATSTAKARQLFTERFVSENLGPYDRLFLSYLEFEKVIIDSLNSQLINNPAYERINSLVWRDTTRYEPEALTYQQQMLAQGFVLGSTEGSIYIDRATEPLRATFYSHLSEAGQAYFTQWEREVNEGLADDGGLIIPVNDLANRLAYWDKFIKKYPKHIFTPMAQEDVKVYLYFLMAGMDNTPAFDHESDSLEPDFRKALESFVTDDTNLESVRIIKEYLELLKANDFKRTNKIDQFIEKHSIW